MARVKTPNPPSYDMRPSRPASTPEARENQLIALAIDLVEQRLRDGTASSQETTHFLKLASNKYKLEVERQKYENELIKEKTKALKDREDMKALYANAIAAMQRYSGHGSDYPDEEESDDYDEY